MKRIVYFLMAMTWLTVYFLDATAFAVKVALVYGIKPTYLKPNVSEHFMVTDNISGDKELV